MAVNFLQEVYIPAFNLFSRSVVVSPAISQPGQAAYNARGIFDTNETDVIGLDNQIFSDAKTELDILIDEFPILPKQGDIIFIPYEADVDGGTFEVLDLAGVGNAGGEITLTLKRIVESNTVIITGRYIIGVPVSSPARIYLGTIAQALSYDLGPLDYAVPGLTVI